MASDLRLAALSGVMVHASRSAVNVMTEMRP